MTHQANEKPATSPLKILWVNPVNLTGYDQPIADLIAAVKLPNREVHVISLDLGDSVLTNLEWRGFESKIWFPVTAVARYAATQGFDGYAIGCFLRHRARRGSRGIGRRGCVRALPVRAADHL